MKKSIILLAVFIIVSCTNQSLDTKWQYYNQKPPGKNAKIFAPEIIKHMAHSAPTFTSDGKEIYWSTVSGPDDTRKIYYVKYENKKWSEPRVVSFSGKYHDDQPFLSYDGARMFFASKRPKVKDGAEKNDLWASKRVDEEWSEPQLMQDSIGFWTPTLADNDNIYFMDLIPGYKGNRGIFKSEFRDGKYSEPEFLPGVINKKESMEWTPFIARNESYLIFSSDREGGFGNGDLYISFRKSDNSWSEVINMGPKVNTGEQERFPGVSPDGKYLFFTRSFAPPNLHDLYWISADIIDSLKALN